MIRRFLIFASLAVLAAFSAIPPASATDLLTIERSTAADTLAVPWSDVAVVATDVIQVDTPMKLDAFGAIFFKTNNINVLSATDVECYQHIDPGRSVV